MTPIFVWMVRYSAIQKAKNCLIREEIIMDINTKKLKKNAFRVSKVRGLTASRVRVPGGCCNADVMQQVVDIARKYGNGQIHLTTRQGFEIEGIHVKIILYIFYFLTICSANTGFFIISFISSLNANTEPSFFTKKPFPDFTKKFTGILIIFLI